MYMYLYSHAIECWPALVMLFVFFFSDNSSYLSDTTSSQTPQSAAAAAVNHKNYSKVSSCHSITLMILYT